MRWLDGGGIARRPVGSQSAGDQKHSRPAWRPAGGTTDFVKTKGGFEFSYQLVSLVKELGGFSIGTAGFPEGHIACKEGKEVDWDRLKAKIDCGADFVLTQYLL